MVDITALSDSFNQQYKAKAEQDNLKGSNTTYDSINPGEFFIRSAAEAIPTFFGAEHSDFVKQGQEEYPGLALGADFLGTGALYGAAFNASKIGRFGKFIEGIGDAEVSPFLTGAKRGAARFAPLEAARIGTTAAFNPDNLKEVAQSAAFNTVLEAGLGSLGTAISSAGKVEKKTESLFGNLKNPPQIQMRELAQGILEGKVPEESIPKARNQLARLRESILSEQIGGKGRAGEPLNYVGDLLDDGDSQVVNRMFKTSIGKEDKGSLFKKRLLSSTTDFKSPTEAADAITKAGLQDNLDAVQFPRHISFNNDKTAKVVENNFTRLGKFQTAGDGILYTKEKEGMYVIAKKIEGEVGKSKATDQWVLFKTDDPGRFAPKGAAWAKKVDDRLAFLREKPRVPDPTNPLDIYDEAQRLADTLPFEAYKEAEKTGAFSQGASYAARKLGLANGADEVFKRGSEFVRDYFAPAMFQFKNSPRAKYIHAIAKGTYDRAKEMAQGLTYGEQIVGDASLLKQLWRGLPNGGKFKGGNSVKAILDPLSDEDIGHMLNVWEQQLKSGDVKKLYEANTVNDKVYKALQQLDNVDSYMVNQIRKTQEATGQKQLVAMKGHYMLSRVWDGDWRVPLSNARNKVVYVASGKTRDAAQKEAERIVAEGRKQGVHMSAGASHVYDNEQDLELAHHVQLGSAEYQTAAAIKSKIRVDAMSPKTFKARQGVGGYKADYTKQELLDRFYNQINTRQRYMAELSINDLMQSELMKLNVEDPKLARDLQRRLSQMSGKQGTFAQAQNHAVDAIVAPVLGKNSATKISGALNAATYHLQLGMGNLAFPVINALTFVQTVLPKMAFLSSATESSLMRHFTWYPVNGTRAKPVGGMGVMDAFKMMKNSMREMGKPDEMLLKNFGRAINDGTIDPKFIEEAVGDNAKQVLSFRDALKSGADPFAKFVDTLGAASSFLPGLSEKFARGHTFTVGHMVGRDWFNLKDDALYRFSKEFTEQTMFNYGTADRARVMTAPMGRFFGLFKNWQAHYIGSMLEYAGEGFGKGNWNPLLWQMGGTASLAGVAGLPLYSVANTFSKWASDKSLMEHLYSQFNGDPDAVTGGISDALYMGLPSFLGVSISGQTAAPLADPARDASMLFSFVQADRAKAIGSFVGAAMDKWQTTGEHPIDSPEVRDKFVAAFAPKAIARSVSVTQDRAIKSLNTGNTQIEGLNLAESMLYQAGFMPRRVALAHAVNEELFVDQKKKEAAVQNMGKAWMEAEAAGDSDALYHLQSTAMADGVDISSVIKSAKSREAKIRDPRLARQYDAAELSRFMDIGVVK